MLKVVSRNMVIPVWFAIFALVAIFTPPLHFFPSVFLLIVGLAVPTVMYLLWRDTPVPAGVGAPQGFDGTSTKTPTESD